jgi:two-component system chemotaxis response regulator CheY
MPPRILIVDDDPSQIFVLIDMLKQLVPSAVVESTTDSTEALHRLTQEHFDLLITDFRMPKITGTELIKAVLNEPSYPKKLLLVSGDSTLDLESTFKLCNSKDVWFRLVLRPYNKWSLKAKLVELGILP